MNDIALLDATAQADLVRRKQVKPIELVDAALDRVARINPKINAIVNSIDEQARRVAAGALSDGPFIGVPFLLKDFVAHFAGVRYTEGSAFLDGLIPAVDSELVKRHKRAGLITIGKTNTPEFALLPTTEPRLFGATRNPWDPNRTPGGSSGGSAAAVAAGIVPMAHANDSAGSIRIPASCCGLFGLKPTRGRNPLGPHFGDSMSGLLVERAVTRSVRDSAALLDATSGPDIGDPYWAPPNERPFIQEVGANPGRLRIGFSQTAPAGTPLHPDCGTAVREAASLCEDLGHEVVEAMPQMDHPRLMSAFMLLWASGAASSIDAHARALKRIPTPESFEPLTWALYEIGKRRSASDYLLAVMDLQRISREVAPFFVEYDLWLTPTLGEPPIPLGTLSTNPESPLTAFVRGGIFVPFTPVSNVTGQPAMSVPLHWNSDGLPIGVHFTARFGDEATLFRLAAQLEDALPWANKLRDLLLR